MSAREDAKKIGQYQRQLDERPISTKEATDAYREGWERTFAKKPEKQEEKATR